jgi:hypothetical protein
LNEYYNYTLEDLYRLRAVAQSALAQPLQSALAQPLQSALAQPLQSALAQPLQSALAQPLQSALAQPLSPLRGDEIFKGVNLQGCKRCKKWKYLFNFLI